MSKARRLARIKRRADGATSALRLIVVGGSAWLLWKKYQRDLAEEEALQAALSRPSQSAMAPLVATEAMVIPAQGARDVSYQGVSQDQQDTTALLQTPQVLNLDPNAVVNQLKTWFLPSAS